MGKQVIPNSGLWSSIASLHNSNYDELYLGLNNTTIYVSVEADFPSQDVNNIYIEAGFNYTPTASFSTSKTMVFQGGRIVGTGKRLGVTLTYTGTGAQFSAIDNSMQISDVAISAPSGSHYSFTSSGGNFFTLDAITSASSVSQGTISGCQGVSISQYTLIASSSTSGFIFAGSSGVISVDTFATIGAVSGFKTFDFASSVFTGGSIKQFFQDASQFGNDAGSIAISGLASSGNVDSGGVIIADSCNFVGITSPLENVSISDIRWELMNCPPLQNSSKEAEAFLSTTQLVAIVTEDVFVPIGGALWLSEVSERFSVSTAGIITFIGERPIKCFVSMALTVDKLGGGSEQIEARLSLNSVTTGSGFEKTGSVTQNTEATSMTSQRLVTIEPGDTIQGYIANNGSTSNVDVLKANLAIIEVR